MSQVPIETQQAQYEINLIFAKTFETEQGKKCLEIMRQYYFDKQTPLDYFSTQNAPLLAGRAAIQNMILDIERKIERAKDGPPQQTNKGD